MVDVVSVFLSLSVVVVVVESVLSDLPQEERTKAKKITENKLKRIFFMIIGLGCNEIYRLEMKYKKGFLGGMAA